MASNLDNGSTERPYSDAASNPMSQDGSDASSQRNRALNRRIAPTQLLQTNPFALLDYEAVMADTEKLARDHGILDDDIPVFKKGAALAKAQEHEMPFENVPQITDALDREETASLKFEREHPWRSLPKMGYFQAAVCAGCAVVQGADQTIINGAQV